MTARVPQLMEKKVLQSELEAMVEGMREQLVNARQQMPAKNNT